MEVEIWAVVFRHSVFLYVVSVDFIASIFRVEELLLQNCHIKNITQNSKKILEIYTDNTIRIRISKNTTEERVINQGVRQGCPYHQHYLIYI
jgi:hypothetical protein